MNSLHQSAVPVTSTIAYTFGKQDAKAGASCCPEMYFVRHADQVAYCHGYAAIAGETLTTRYFLSDEDIAAEAEAYADDIADREYHSRGQW